MDLPYWTTPPAIREGITINPVLRSLELYRWLDSTVPQAQRARLRSLLLARIDLNTWNGRPPTSATLEAFAEHISSLVKQLFRERLIE